MALKVQVILNAWKEFDLHNTQQQIDETATQVTAKQDESDLSKKKLVELSKEFKKNTSEETRKQVAPLLKNFQLEIDNLNKRSKFAETAFLNVYKNIIEIVDPVPSLEYCIGIEKKLGKCTDLEIENKNLRETLREYNEEFREIRNQDVTIKSLKEKVKAFEENVNDNVSAKAKEFETELLSQYSEKEQLLQESQSSAVRRLLEAEARSVTLQQTLEHTQSELFEYKNRSEEFTSAHSEETNILTIDLDRANQRVLIAEKEVATLEDQLAQALEENNTQATSSTTSNLEANVDMLTRSSLEVELSAKSQEISQLVEDVKKLQTAMQYLREETSRKVQIMEAQLDEKTTLTDELQTLLKSQTDYQEIKRELNIIKSIEFGVEERMDVQDDGLPNKSLEILLLEKNKSLQNENTVLKQTNLDLSKHISESNHEVSTLRSLSSEQKVLITQLESDLASMQSFSSLYRGEGEGCPSMPEMVAEAVKGSSISSDALQGVGVERDSVDGRDSVASHVRSSSITSSPLPGADTQSAAESLLPIVTAQRERFKAKNDELEAELTVKKQQVTLVQNEVDTLRNDNVKLYEKIRFLQSYRGQQSNETSNTAESRYSGQYEESLDPFSSFSRTERMRRYSALSPFEKITLSLGRFILSNKTARTVSFLYTGMLHVLVFLVLYKLAHTESCKRDLSSDCAQRFAEHMHDVHGDAEFNG